MGEGRTMQDAYMDIGGRATQDAYMDIGGRATQEQLPSSCRAVAEMRKIVKCLRGGFLTCDAAHVSVINPNTSVIRYLCSALDIN